jgi:hypothetical protein
LLTKLSSKGRANDPIFFHEGTIFELLQPRNKLFIFIRLKPCSRSVTFETDPDPDLDPRIPSLDYGSRSGSGFGSCSFFQWLSRCQQYISFFLSFFAYFFYRYI